MSRKIIYLINPISGTRSKEPLLRMIRQKTTARGIPFEILQTNKDGDYHWLKQKIKEDPVTDVIICGGDGSVSNVAGALLQEDVRFGVVPMGSGNGLALAAKIPVQHSRSLEIVFDAPDRPIDGFFINNRFSCMLCGIGFDAQVAHDFANSPKRGLQNYIRLSAINFFKARPYSFTIESSDRKIETEAFLLVIANSNQFGNNFTIAPKASLDDGLLDIVIVKKMNKLMLPLSILGQVTGINAVQDISDFVDAKNIIYFQSDTLKITNHGMAPLHIDGDPAESNSTFEIRIKPKAFRLIQPL
ncbi:MAG TPA: YegS/Rv2252/BmrU family lipid kinase [Flavitalea sp.]|nr:YegS/Rv2252/BmrU family lipid kinase [Flavitalea sp.]